MHGEGKIYYSNGNIQFNGNFINGNKVELKEN